jgi:hypothetical protein
MKTNALPPSLETPSDALSDDDLAEVIGGRWLPSWNARPQTFGSWRSQSHRDNAHARGMARQDWDRRHFVAKLFW